MANTLSALNPENWRPMVQDFLNNMLVSKAIANMQFRAEMVDGDQINWPQISDVRAQDYTPGTDVTVDDLAGTQSSLLIDKSRIVAFPVDPTEVRQARDSSFPAKMARQAAFRLSNDIDQKVIQEGVNNAANTVAGGTLTAATIYSSLTDVMATLDRENATDGTMFAILDPERVALLAQSEVADGFNLADTALKNGFVGPSQAGFKIFKSNNLPVSVTLTQDTMPTDGDTVTMFGVTFTFKTALTPTAGEVLIGASNATAQANLVSAATAGGTAGVDYVELSVEDRRKLQNAGIGMTAFAADISTITGFGKIGGLETYTAVTNVFGTETGSMLAGRMGAVSLALQMLPNLFIREEPKQIQDNYLTHTLYGTKAFSRDTFRLVNFTYNV